MVARYDRRRRGLDPVAPDPEVLWELASPAKRVLERIESPSDDHDPFWLVTGYDEVMRISKDNTGFLNAPRATVFTNHDGERFARAITASQGDESPNLVSSLVVLDAPRASDASGVRTHFISSGWPQIYGTMALPQLLREIAIEGLERRVQPILREREAQRSGHLGRGVAAGAGPGSCRAV